jgi:hypothetical protein
LLLHCADVLRSSDVRIDIGQGVIVTSSITNEAFVELGLQKGDEACAFQFHEPWPGEGRDFKGTRACGRISWRVYLI